MGGLLAALVPVYGVAVWLGLYLVRRDPRSPLLRLSGLGLVAYALALAVHLLDRAVGPGGDAAAALARARFPFLLLPALCWAAALPHLLPEEAPRRDRLVRASAAALPPAALVALVVGVAAGGEGSGGGAEPGDAVRVGLVVAVLAPLLAMVFLVWRWAGPGRGRPVLGAPAVASLFFGLSTGLLLVPLDLLPRVWVLLLLGLDLVALGLAIARLDALAGREALLPDAVRAFDAAALAALAFGGQVALAMALGAGPTAAMTLLLLATVATAVAAPTFADLLAAGLDRVALRRFPRARRERGELRAAASAVPRLDPALDPRALEAAEFARLTRRALSHFGDLPRLAASPLTHLRLVECRLAARGAPDDALERAAELKLLLAESVARLKPRGGDFGTSDEWRFYNALHFPYVVGLKPYSRRVGRDPADPAAREALAWFRLAVPERTLHNWQTAAARLVAEDLRRRDAAAG